MSHREFPHRATIWLEYQAKGTFRRRRVPILARCPQGEDVHPVKQGNGFLLYRKGNNFRKSGGISFVFYGDHFNIISGVEAFLKAVNGTLLRCWQGKIYPGDG